MKRNDFFKILISLVVSVVLLAILASQINPSDLNFVLKSISLEYLLLAFFLYLAVGIFRAMRFQLLLNKRIPLRNMVPIVLVHTLFLNVLPARTGELSLLYLLKRRRIDLKESVPILLIARVFDGIAMAAIFLISVFLLGKDAPKIISDISLLVIMSLSLAVVFLVSFFCFGSRWMRISNAIIEKTRLRKFAFADSILKKFSNLVEGFKAIQMKEKILLLIAYSFCIWVFSYLVYFVLMTDMAIRINLWQVFTGASFVVLSSLLPIQGLAGFGTVEGTWALVFLALGVEKELAIASGLGFHVLQIIFAIVLASISAIVMKYEKGSGTEKK